MQSEQAQVFLDCSESLLLLGPENLRSWTKSTALKEIISEGNRYHNPLIDEKHEK